MLREAYTDRYFPQKFSKLSITQQECLPAINVFGDKAINDMRPSKAEDELQLIAEISNSACRAKEKFQSIWDLIKGE